ncbi:MAG: GNAT family N-acetyltransferase [Anaerolineaceae bacterium]
MDTFEEHRGDYLISTDPARLQIDVISQYLSGVAYWAKGRSMEVIKTSIENSLNFGVYHNGRQVGFARVVSDFAVFAWLGDVFVLEEERGQGLGKWLVDAVVSYPGLRNLQRFILATNDAHELYRRYGGFDLIPNPECWMTQPPRRSL